MIISEEGGRYNLNELKEARQAAGLTQQQMSDLMSIPKRSIENWESGSRTPPPYVKRFILNELKTLIDNICNEGK